MTTRLHTDHITHVHTDRWYEIADNSYTIDNLILEIAKGAWHEAGIHYTFTTTDGTHHAGPLTAVTGYRFDDR